MLKFLQTPKGLIITGAIVLVLVLLITYNWGKISGWFQGMGSTGRQARVCRTTCPDGLLVQYDCQMDSDPCINHQKK